MEKNPYEILDVQKKLYVTVKHIYSNGTQPS